MEHDRHPKDTENKRVAKAAGVVGAATFLSRIFGFLRDVVVAAFFGAGVATDAFFVAFRIPNVLRRLFAEGSLTIAFIPVFTEYLKRKSKEDAIELANAAFTLLSIILVVVSLLGIVFAPWIVKIIGWGFIKTPDRFELTVFLTRIMFPYIFFISLMALAMGILNSLRHFAAPALAPVVLNIAMIAAVFLLGHAFDEPITALAVGVMVGGVLQLAMQFPFLVRVGVRIRANFHFRHPGIRQIGLLMLPAVFGAAVYQINVLVGTLLASFLPIGSVSYLYYADRLVQFPLGVFAIAISTAVLPSLSREAARGDLGGLRETLSYALRLTMFITIPAMTGLIVLREPIIRLLFQRGAFDSLTTVMTAQALLFYSIGLWAFAALRVFVSAFYSLQDTKTPVKVAVIAMLANILFSVALMGPLKHGGLALALSLASTLQLCLLIYLLRKRLGGIGGSEVVGSMMRSIFSSVIMGVGIYFLAATVFGDSTTQGFAGLTLRVIMVIGAGLFVYLVCARIFGSTELSYVMELLRREKKTAGP